MGKLISNAIKLPNIIISLMSDLRRQKRFMKLNIAPILESAKTSNDSTLSDKDFIKINKYYGLAVPAILGESFCVLRGSSMTKCERWASTCQGAITGLFDDFFDDLKLPEEQIVRMVNNPENIIPNTSTEKLFLEFYRIVLQKAAFPNAIKKQLLQVHKAQVASVEQEDSNIDVSRIWEITRLKGGDSVLFYRTAFDNMPTVGEEDALFQLGAVMQLENDIFDIYKDYKSGISTLPTTLVEVNELYTLYKQQIDYFIELCYKMDYPRKRVEKFLDRIMPVLSRGFVCLDSYQKLENNNNGIFNIEAFTRKQLICDMEKLSNFFKTIKYQVTITFLF